jgi:hypothetical protein
MHKLLLILVLLLQTPAQYPNPHPTGATVCREDVPTPYGHVYAYTQPDYFRLGVGYMPIEDWVGYFVMSQELSPLPRTPFGIHGALCLGGSVTRFNSPNLLLSNSKSYTLISYNNFLVGESYYAQAVYRVSGEGVYLTDTIMVRPLI